jgi:hypothetical protein
MPISSKRRSGTRRMKRRKGRSRQFPWPKEESRLRRYGLRRMNASPKHGRWYASTLSLVRIKTLAPIG